jgi:hypothetical protein
MTPEIIRDYFLRAGASFRKSSAWRKEHDDVQGHSRVLRTGRFGVGALAAYLLGDEIEVTTRHLFADPLHGIKFTARLDDEAISLDRIKGLVRRIMEGWGPSPLRGKHSSTAYLPKKLVEKIKGMRPGREMQTHLETLEASQERNAWVRVASNETRLTLDDVIMGLEQDEDDPVVFYVIEIDEVSGEETSHPLMERWMEICGTPVIPFDPNKRRTLEARASQYIMPKKKIEERKWPNAIGKNCPNDPRYERSERSAHVGAPASKNTRAMRDLAMTSGRSRRGEIVLACRSVAERGVQAMAAEVFEFGDFDHRRAC